MTNRTNIFIAIILLSGVHNSLYASDDEENNFYKCKFYGSRNVQGSSINYLIDRKNKKIYESVYSNFTHEDKSQVSVYELTGETYFAVRGALLGKYSGNYLSEHQWQDWNNNTKYWRGDKMKPILSLDKTRGFYILTGGIKDSYGKCYLFNKHISNINNTLKDIAVRMRLQWERQ